MLSPFGAKGILVLKAQAGSGWEGRDVKSSQPEEVCIVQCASTL